VDLVTDFGEEVAALATAMRARGWRLATAESCTGGLIAAACTALAGSSDWFERGVVSYSNAAKAELLGVEPALIDAHGAVSEPVARAMAEGALAHAPAQWALAVTGIAGPGGAVPGKPVGTVWLAWGRAGEIRTERLQLAGDRDAVRGETVAAVLQRLADSVQGAEGGLQAGNTKPGTAAGPELGPEPGTAAQ
jgi:nicotinamide-nucleotide amidase